VHRLKVAAGTAGGLAALFLLLSIPSAEPERSAGTRAAFSWNADAQWRALESTFVQVRATGCPRSIPLTATEPEGFFAIGPVVAACPQFQDEYVRRYSRMRKSVKTASRAWDLTTVAARDRLYRALYGGRAAVEEAMLQRPESATALLREVDESSATPAAVVRGVDIHSGDILVSRGGYPTSALIARGNDYPGNFSHVGLVHVDSVSHAVSVIEAHIERGVVATTADGYLADKKLRLMVLRPRADLPQLVRDPMLPHRAAERALARVRAGHIPYDFTMDYTDPSRLFCSEVASWVYRDQGVTLWMALSTISSSGLRRWLGSFGVRHFETQEPSDLEYDPQLVVVAEWRDPQALFQDHVDNAVIDAMLEGAERGDGLTYAWYALAPARVAKAYSWTVERFGGVGPVPEGMSAAAALRNSAFSARQRLLAGHVHEAAARFMRERGYRPPYWALLDLAREATAAW